MLGIRMGPAALLGGGSRHRNLLSQEQKTRSQMIGRSAFSSMPLSDQSFARPWTSEYQSLRDGLTPQRVTYLTPLIRATPTTPTSSRFDPNYLFNSPATARDSAPEARQSMVSATTQTSGMGDEAKESNGAFQLLELASDARNASRHDPSSDLVGLFPGQETIATCIRHRKRSRRFRRPCRRRKLWRRRPRSGGGWQTRCCGRRIVCRQGGSRRRCGVCLADV